MSKKNIQSIYLLKGEKLAIDVLTHPTMVTDSRHTSITLTNEDVPCTVRFRDDDVEITKGLGSRFMYLEAGKKLIIQGLLAPMTITNGRTTSHTLNIKDAPCHVKSTNDYLIITTLGEDLNYTEIESGFY